MIIIFIKHGFQRSNSYPNLYVKKDEDGNIALISFYVDYLIITRSVDGVITSIKEQLFQVLDMKDLGQLHYCLGLEVWRDK